MSFKTCSRCDKSLPIDNFNKKPDGANGRQPRCKPCAWQKQRDGARAAFDWMINFLGPYCRCCGSVEKLTLDHKIPKNWVSNLVSWTQRLARYKKDLAAGLLQVLCDECNRRKSDGVACDCSSYVCLYELSRP